MWADAHCDGRPVEFRWRPLRNAAVLADVHCSSAVHAVTLPIQNAILGRKVNILLGAIAPEMYI